MATAKGSQEKDGGRSNGQPPGSEEEHTALLEKPLVVEGKRQRKSTESFSASNEPKKKAVEYAGGSGVKLGDIARVEFFLSKQTALELKPLHRLCYTRPGTKFEIKKNLRAFSGFPFTEDSEEYQKKRAALEKYQKSGLRLFLEVLDLPRSGSKDEQVERILQFLLSPVNLKKSLPKSKRKRKRSSSHRAGRKTKKTRSSDEGSGEEDSAESADEEEEEEEEVEEDKDSPTGEDEGTTPSDQQLFAAIQKLLKGANLESVTTNSVCQQVFARFPDIDLSERKDYIKQCIGKVVAST